MHRATADSREPIAGVKIPSPPAHSWAWRPGHRYRAKPIPLAGPLIPVTPLFSATASPGPGPRPASCLLPSKAWAAGGFPKCCPPGLGSPAVCPASAFLNRASLQREDTLNSFRTAKYRLCPPAPTNSRSNTLDKWGSASRHQGKPRPTLTANRGVPAVYSASCQGNLCAGPPSHACFADLENINQKEHETLSRVLVRCRGAGIWTKPGGFCHLQFWPPLPPPPSTSVSRFSHGR